MANPVLRSFIKDISSRLKIRVEQVRHGHHLRGKPPTIALTLQQRLQCKWNILFFVLILLNKILFSAIIYASPILMIFKYVSMVNISNNFFLYI